MEERSMSILKKLSEENRNTLQVVLSFAQALESVENASRVTLNNVAFMNCYNSAKCLLEKLDHSSYILPRAGDFDSREELRHIINDDIEVIIDANAKKLAGKFDLADLLADAKAKMKEILKHVVDKRN